MTESQFVVSQIDLGTTEKKLQKFEGLMKKVTLALQFGQFFIMIFFFGTFSFLPVLLGIDNGDERWYYNKLIWIKWGIIIPTQIMVWYYFIGENVVKAMWMLPNEGMRTMVSRVGVVFLFAGLVSSLLYDCYYLVHGCIVVYKSRDRSGADPTELMVSNTNLGFSITLLILNIFDGVAVIAEGIIIAIFLRKVSGVMPALKNMGVITYAKFLERDVGAEKARDYLQDNLTQAQLNSLAGGNNNWNKQEIKLLSGGGNENELEFI